MYAAFVLSQLRQAFFRLSCSERRTILYIKKLDIKQCSCDAVDSDHKAPFDTSVLFTREEAADQTTFSRKVSNVSQRFRDATRVHSQRGVGPVCTCSHPRPVRNFAEWWFLLRSRLGRNLILASVAKALDPLRESSDATDSVGTPAEIQQASKPQGAQQLV